MQETSEQLNLMNYLKPIVIVSDFRLYKQAGNSVTVNMIYEIAKRLK